MTTSMMPGANQSLVTDRLSVHVVTGKTADVSCFQLYADGKTQGDPDFVFYGQKHNENNSVQLAHEGLTTVFEVDLARIKPDVKRIAFTVTVDSGTIANLSSSSIRVLHQQDTLCYADVPMQSRPEAALILGELYRRNEEWKFRFVCQGFNGGLAALAEHYGVEIEDSPPEPVEPVPAAPVQTSITSPAAPPINLSKITLTKASPSINLAKNSSNTFGQIRVNLNWNQGPKKTGGLLASMFSTDTSIDLDLGAYVHLSDGRKDLIQSLDKNFGNYSQPPYIELQGDDRTGAQSDGEWIHINGDHWAEITEILIYAFIYEGSPNWSKTCGIATLHIPDQPPIETRLTEGPDDRGFCVIARLVNINGELKVERLDEYFNGHRQADAAYGWDFAWAPGKK